MKSTIDLYENNKIINRKNLILQIESLFVKILNIIWELCSLGASLCFSNRVQYLFFHTYLWKSYRVPRKDYKCPCSFFQRCYRLPLIIWCSLNIRMDYYQYFKKKRFEHHPHCYSALLSEKLTILFVRSCLIIE